MIKVRYSDAIAIAKVATENFIHRREHTPQEVADYYLETLARLEERLVRPGDDGVAE